MLTPAQVVADGLWPLVIGAVFLIGLGAGAALMYWSGKPDRKSSGYHRGYADGVNSPDARFHAEAAARRDRPLALTEPQPGRFWTRNTEPVHIAGLGEKRLT